MKESAHRPDKKLIFSENFDSEQGVRSRGGISTDVTFENGVGSFNGTSSRILYSFFTKSKPYSIRIKYTRLNPISNCILIDFRVPFDGILSGSIYQQDNTFIPESGTIYIDGVLTNVWSTSTKEIIVSGMVINTKGFYLCCNNAATGQFLDADIDLVEIYSGTLTADEVKNLYENKRYKAPVLNHALQYGEDIITGWSNYGGSFETLITDGKLITSAINSSAWGGTYSNNLGAVSPGDKIKVTYTLGLNSGIITYAYIGTISFTAVSQLDSLPISGTHTVEFVIHTANSSSYLLFEANNGNCNFNISSITVQRSVVNETKVILDVNAFDGVARNKLSAETYKELITDGFNNSGWVLTTGASILNGVCRFINFPYVSYIQNNLSLVTGKYYRLTFTIKNYVKGYLRWFGNGFYAENFISNGVFTFDFTADYPVIYCYNIEVEGATFDMENISIKEIIPSVVCTDVAVVKEGSINVMKFNGYTSEIICGSYDPLISDNTIVLWVNPKKYNNSWGGNAFLFTNGIILIILTGSSYILFSRDGGTHWLLPAPPPLNIYSCFVFVNKANGLTDVYLNGAYRSSHTALGYGIAGTVIRLGGYPANNNDVLIGHLPHSRVINGLLTSQEISQIYTSEKAIYGL